MQPINIVKSNIALSDLAIFMIATPLDSQGVNALRDPSVSWRGGGRSWQNARCRLLPCSRPFLDHIKDAGYEKDSNRTGSEHSADYCRPHNLARYRTSAARSPQWNTTEDKRERRHQDRAQPQPRAFKSRVREWFSLFELILGEFDDQDRVFRRQADQHDKADLRVDVAFDLHH